MCNIDGVREVCFKPGCFIVEEPQEDGSSSFKSGCIYRASENEEEGRTISRNLDSKALLCRSLRSGPLPVDGRQERLPRDCLDLQREARPLLLRGRRLQQRGVQPKTQDPHEDAQQPDEIQRLVTCQLFVFGVKWVYFGLLIRLPFFANFC